MPGPAPAAVFCPRAGAVNFRQQHRNVRQALRRKGAHVCRLSIVAEALVAWFSVLMPFSGRYRFPIGW